jgi:putative ABC transport system ATP-binding protein
LFVAFFANSSSPPGRCARHASSDCEPFDPTIAQGGASVPGNPLKTPGDAVTCGGVPRHGICRALVDVIRLANVSKVVTSGSEQLTILNGVDLEVPRGQFVAVVGPSGSGKSTLLSLVAGLDAPSGDIFIDGQNTTRMKEDDLADLRGAKVGFIFQAFHLIPSLTAYENILVPMEIMGCPAAQSRAQALVEEVGLRARAHHYPSQLSGGEQQRVAIARAFSNDPQLLLADEPTGNLDTRNGAHVLELLVKLNRERGTTLLLVTHEHTLASVAERRISLNEGRIVSDEHMRFILNMAWRETRASWFRLLLFFLCIAIGVGSMVSLRSFTQNLRASILRESRSLVAADVRVENAQPWKAEALAILNRYSASSLVTAHTEIIETQTMVRPANGTDARPVMVFVRGIKEDFPLYGEVEMAADQGRGAENGAPGVSPPYSFALVKDRGALVSPSLLNRLNVRVGDEIKIGRSIFTIRGVAQRVPGTG